MCRKSGLIKASMIESKCNNCSHSKRKHVCKRTTKKSRQLKAHVSMYYAISDGASRIYTDEQRINGYSRILSPKKVSLINVFINGVPQSPISYTIHRGRFRLKTIGVPTKGVPIIIQFIRFGTRKKRCVHKAVAIIKPFVTATSSSPVASGGAVSTAVNPDVPRFIATITAGMIGFTDTTITATSFVDDNGTAVIVLPSPPTHGYFNVYVNGILQEGGLSTLSTASLFLETTEFSPGVPVVLEVADFSNTTSTITTEPTISAPIITVTT